MNLQESGEMYLESIYVLSKRQSEVHSIDISEYMGYSKPRVSRAMGLLKNGGYILIDEDNHISLTESGLEIAKKIYDRHTLLTAMLVQLGVPEEIAAQDACKMEHGISDESLEAIRKHMSDYRK